MKHAMNWGAVLGLLLIMLSLALYLLDLNESGLTGIAYVFIIGVICYGIFQRRKEQNGFISYGEGLATGTAISFFGGVIAAFYSFLHMSFIDTHQLERLLANMEDQLFESGAPQSQVDIMMGMYEKILGALTASIGGDFQSIIQILVFILGCILGLLAFSRLLQWLLLHYHDPVVAVLTGFMIGSLNKVWPWKNTLETYLDRHGEVKPLIQENILPPQLDAEFFIALALAIFAFLFVYILEKKSKKAIINV